MHQRTAWRALCAMAVSLAAMIALRPGPRRACKPLLPWNIIMAGNRLNNCLALITRQAGCYKQAGLGVRLVHVNRGGLAITAVMNGSADAQNAVYDLTTDMQAKKDRRPSGTRWLRHHCDGLDAALAADPYRRGNRRHSRGRSSRLRSTVVLEAIRNVPRVDTIPDARHWIGTNRSGGFRGPLSPPAFRRHAQARRSGAKLDRQSAHPTDG